jgi:hypothetical protein
MPACPVGPADRTGVVIFLTCLDLEQKSLFMDGHELRNQSMSSSYRFFGIKNITPASMIARSPMILINLYSLFRWFLSRFDFTHCAVFLEYS